MGTSSSTRAAAPSAPDGARSDRVQALADTLAEANTQVYRDKIAEIAHAFGAQAPDAVTDASVLAGIQERATVSARSIVSTQADVAVRLIDQYGSGEAAQPYYDQFTAYQADMVSSYETAMTAAQAVQDFVANNDQLSGQEWWEPADAMCDECADAVGLGQQPLGTLDAPPAHPNCQHSLATDFAAVDDPSGLWLGQLEGGDGEGDGG